MGIIRRSGNISSKTSSTSNFQVEREPVYYFICFVTNLGLGLGLGLRLGLGYYW